MSVFIGFQGFRLVFHVSRSVLMVLQGSRFVCMVPGWFFTVPDRFFMVHIGFHRFSSVEVDFSWVKVSFYGFSRFQVGFLLFKVGFYGSRFS